MVNLFRFNDENRIPYLLKFRSSKAFIVVAVCLAVFTDVFLYGIIVPVLPFALSQRTGVPESSVQHWISILLACYGASLSVFSPICGIIADRTESRRFPLLFGLICVGAATVMLCIGNSIGMLVVARLAQGASAAFVWVIGMALLVDTVEPNEVGRMMGYVSLFMSCGTVIAPLLGGVVYARGGYYKTYAMAFALIGIDILFRLMLIEKKIAKKWLPTTNEQSSPASLSADDAAAGDHQSVSTHDVDDAVSPGAEQSSRPTAEADDGMETRHAGRVSSRLPPILMLLHSPRVVTALWGCLVQGVLLTSFDSVLPLYAKSTFNFTSLSSSLLFLCLSVPCFLGPLFGYLCDRIGPRIPTFLSFLLCTAPLVLLRLVTYNSKDQIILLCILLALIGLSLALGITPLMAEVSIAAEAHASQLSEPAGEQGVVAQAYGLFNLAFAAGTLVGPIWAGYVRTLDGWPTMCWSLGALSATTAIPALLWTGGWLGCCRSSSKTTTVDEPVAVA